MKELKTIVTFPNTHAALAAEKFVKMHNLDGRIIPIPVELSAECGLSLCLDLDAKDEFIKQAQKSHIIYSHIYTIEI